MTISYFLFKIDIIYLREKEMKEITIREANIKDSKQILDIYSPYILKTPITFEYSIPTLEQFKKRVENTLEKYPYLVCEENNEIIGYAYAGAYKGRKAYDFTAELSIYIKEGYDKKGIGKNLYSALIDILKKKNLQILYACITIHKTLGSNQFHEKLGFKKIGFFEKSGYKDYNWYDTAWYSLEIGNFETNPKEIIPITKLSSLEKEKILQKYNNILNKRTI